MDTRDGRIYDQKTMDKLRETLMSKAEFEKYVKPMELPPTVEQMSRMPPRVGRNEPCPCGSGRKFKKCCYSGDAAAAKQPRNPGVE